MRKEKALSPEDIARALKTYCCQAECLKKAVNKEDMLKCRKDFRSLSEEDQRAFLLNFFTFRVYHHKGTFGDWVFWCFWITVEKTAELETDTFDNKCKSRCYDWNTLFSDLTLGKRCYTFRLPNGKDICRKAWLTLTVSHRLRKYYTGALTVDWRIYRTILNLRPLEFLSCRFHRLLREYEQCGRTSAEGARQGREMSKPSTLKAESWFKGP